MKCLYCDRSLADQQSLENHYVDFHNLDENNHFFRKLFTRNNVFVPRKCFHCDHLCINRRDEKNHNFLSEYKPLKKTFFDENLKKVLYKLP